MALSDCVTRSHIGLIHEIGSESINLITPDKWRLKDYGIEQRRGGLESLEHSQLWGEKTL